MHTDKKKNQTGCIRIKYLVLYMWVLDTHIERIKSEMLQKPFFLCQAQAPENVLYINDVVLCWKFIYTAVIWENGMYLHINIA